ncbi:hypothetical protein [Bdellovibrio sp. GT3]|uniref:hypothetical protein n=1 Tax=Bdellovibrio sp. GT3 TaxID=3136282 RepID=UPI0030F289A4
MSEINPLVIRLIELVKQHKNPSSPKSTAVLVKVMEKQLLNPGNHSVEKFKKALQQALDSEVVLSELIRQQHSEDELRGCLVNLLEALNQEEK